MRADFRRFYGIPFSDVVRGRVPLAEGVSLFVDLLHNPDASVARVLNDDEAPWRIGDYLTAHVWTALTGEKHPALPSNVKRAQSDPQRQAQVNRALERKRERERLIAEGVIT
ncbi:hypothetical protein NYO98_10435 [Nocardioides sp. STR2]|uniref:Uncharacterized protein n=1 Tax=Nocardioides pini TaxID=2975053 RepID=A0ABT4CCK3_9ACTN|nr:hypothetical protein [Nocardioides pini]MCY4726695.1 hypothetical protein [Nocardioides pini]